MKYCTILLLLSIAAADNFMFTRILKCVQNNAVRCLNWNQSTTLTYATYFSSFCFSENTYVQTREGPKSMKNLQIHDQILSYDHETGKQRYSKVVAWLHRDAQVIARYDTIKTKQGPSFQASDYHNIAFVNSQGKIQFKFAKDLSQGDELVGFPEADPHVEQISNEGQRQGLYSPFTQAGNFYIYDRSVNSSTQDTKTKAMILVHVLSQIKDPNNEINIANKIIFLWEKLGLNTQPEDESYSHPMVTSLNFVFGRNWVQAKQQVFIKPTHQQVLPSFHSLSRRNSNQSRSQPHASSPSHPQHTYTSTYNRERERQDRMKALGLAVSIVEELPLL